MAEIGFMPLPESGHFLPVLKLARALRTRGHQVKFLTVLDLEDDVRGQGFEFVPILTDFFPKGFAKQLIQHPGWRPRQFLQGVRDFRRFGNRVFDTLVREGGNAVFRDPKPDLVIVDALMSPLALLAGQLGIPVLQFNIVLPFVRDPGIPPLTSRIVPSAGSPHLLSDFRIRLAWRLLRVKRFFTNQFFFEIDRQTARLAARCGAPRSGLEMATPFGLPALRLPELVLCPRAFDFPRPESETRHYVGPSLDLERHEVAFPYEHLDPTKPLIYCSFGSQSHLFKRHKHLLQCVVEAVAARPQWQAAVTTGVDLQPDELGCQRPNVFVVQRAPQLQLLQRASVAITHGGLGSIKECITFGVPMIVCPAMRDQPGNAARVKYHGLGLIVNARRVTARRLQLAIERLLGDVGFATRVGHMAREFRQTEDKALAVSFIEDVLENDRTTKMPSVFAGRPLGCIEDITRGH